MNTIEITIGDYFIGFFEEIKFYSANKPGLPNLAFDGKRKGNIYNCFIPPNIYEGEMLFHWLECMKGEIIIAEQTIILENEKHKSVTYFI